MKTVYIIVMQLESDIHAEIYADYGAAKTKLKSFLKNSVKNADNRGLPNLVWRPTLYFYKNSYISFPLKSKGNFF